MEKSALVRRNKQTQIRTRYFVSIESAAKMLCRAMCHEQVNDVRAAASPAK